MPGCSQARYFLKIIPTNAIRRAACRDCDQCSEMPCDHSRESAANQKTSHDLLGGAVAALNDTQRMKARRTLIGRSGRNDLFGGLDARLTGAFGNQSVDARVL